MSPASGRTRETWEKVVRKIRSGMMPPSGARRPERAVLDAFAAELETRLDRAGVASANLGAPALHRLNRTEYANAIRDLLDAGSGRHDAASVGRLQRRLRQHRRCAERLADSDSGLRLRGDEDQPPGRRRSHGWLQTRSTYPAPNGLSQEQHFEGLPLGTRGGMIVKHTFPLDGEYQIAGGGAARRWRWHGHDHRRRSLCR